MYLDPRVSWIREVERRMAIPRSKAGRTDITHVNPGTASRANDRQSKISVLNSFRGVDAAWVAERVYHIVPHSFTDERLRALGRADLIGANHRKNPATPDLDSSTVNPRSSQRAVSTGRCQPDTGVCRV
jgi:hypothetical protein